LYFLPALLLSLSIHEFGHAIVAYKLGDKSQKAMGRLTLSPFAHIDWLGFISIALIGVGWGKPVMVDDRNFEKRGKGNMLVALAGPMFNICLAIIVTIILKILLITGAFEAIVATSVGAMIMDMLFLTIEFNVVFAVFNLIPLPPLDGSKIINGFLPYNLRSWFLNYYHIFHIIFIVIWITGIAGLIISPIISGVSSGIMNIVAALFGVTVI